MEYTNLIYDFAWRTRQNLEHVNEQAALANEGVYPVTQLWNSLLGLIVAPHELEVDRIPTTRMTELWAEGWPRLPDVGSDWSLRRLVKALRNAVAHFNVEFNAEPGREITSVTVWNQRIDSNGRPIKGSRGWQAQITIEDLDSLVTCIPDQYLETFASSAA